MKGTSPTDALHHAYRELAPFSDPQRWEFESMLFQLKFIAGRFPQGTTVLDAGCGIGILTLALKTLGYRAEGIDKYVLSDNAHYGVADQHALKNIWHKHGLTITGEDSVEAAQKGKRYTVCISVAVIEHQFYPRQFVESLIGCLEPHGYLVIVTPNAAKLSNRLRVLMGRAPMANIDEFYTEAEHFSGHVREYTPRELSRMCTLSGLRVVEANAVQARSFKWSRSPLKLALRLSEAVAALLRVGGDASLVFAQKNN